MYSTEIVCNQLKEKKKKNNLQTNCILSQQNKNNSVNEKRSTLKAYSEITQNIINTKNLKEQKKAQSNKICFKTNWRPAVGQECRDLFWLISNLVASTPALLYVYREKQK